MDNFKTNSFKSKEKERIKKKRISNPVSTRKRNEIQKIKDGPIRNDAAKIKEFAISEVIIPYLKKAIEDIVKTGVDMLLYHDTEHRSSSNSYEKYYKKGRVRTSDSSNYRRVKERFDYDEILFETRGDAEMVIDQMMEILRHYDCISVSDMYDLVDLTAPYTAQRYGWDDINTYNSKVVRTMDGHYVLKLPRPMPLDEY